MNKRGMSLLTLAFLLLALTVAYAVSQQTNFDIDSFKSNLTWEHKEIAVKESPDLGNAVTSLVNGLGETAFNLAKWVAQFSYEHPNIPWKLLIWVMIISILAPIIYYGFLACVVIFLLIREWYLSRKEKKEEAKYE